MDANFILVGVAVATPVLTAVATISATKAGLNGSRERLKNVESNAISHEAKDQDRHVEVIQRLARIETKLESK